jgi:pyridoxamine 5'-phosphate oxidase
MGNIADIRRDYKLKSFDEKDAAKNPFGQFDSWWQEAVASDIDEVNAMSLATIDGTYAPYVRIVLLKGYSKKGFVFFTNYNSNKAKEIGAMKIASVLFFWKELERQIRIEGSVKKISDEESDAYFKSRPYESKLGAWASPQSKRIKSRKVIEDNFEKMRIKFPDPDNVPRPKHWGGFIIVPNYFEFWQGRPNRLHDRISYTKLFKSGWSRKRLAP